MEAQEKIRHALRESGLTSREVSGKTGLSAVTIRRFMARSFTSGPRDHRNRYPLRPKSLDKVADLLGLKVETSYRVTKKPARA